MELAGHRGKGARQPRIVQNNLLLSLVFTRHLTRAANFLPLHPRPLPSWTGLTLAVALHPTFLEQEGAMALLANLPTEGRRH